MLNGHWKYSRINLHMFSSFQLDFLKCKFIKARGIVSYYFNSLFHLGNDEILKHVECLRYNQTQKSFANKSERVFSLFVRGYALSFQFVGNNIYMRKLFETD